MADKKGTSYIDVRRTRQSKKDMDQLVESLNDAVGEANKLIKAYQNLGKLAKQADVRAALGNNRGFAAFQRGTDTRARMRAERTGFYGTPTGQRAAELREVRAQEREQLQRLDTERKRRAAINLQLQRELKEVNRLTNAEEIRNKKLIVQERLQMEAGRGAGIQYQNARKLNAALDQRLKDLKEEVSLKKKSAQLTRDERIAQSRRDTRARLFGDGGASLFGIQAGLLANYQIMGGVQTGFSASARFTVELDAALRNLQAIVRITNTDLQSLKQSLISVSEETKFTAVEIANASVTLGQAGFSVQEIKDSIRAVSLLATATGTELDRAVDIATSTLGVFNMESSEMTRVANTMTEAVNTSKLNIEKLTLGLQYSGNIAAQSGVRFEELTAAFGAMANAGIRSGSTLGTGMRQILIGLQKPSKAFIETLDRLGLTLQDVDLRSKGLYGALKTLSDAGFTAQDAIQSFEIRAAAAFNAIQGNLGQVLELETGFRNTAAAIRANEVQMQSLANQGRRLGSVLGSVVATGLEPMKNVLIDITKSMGDFFSVVKDHEGTLQTVTTLFTGFILTVGTLFTGRLLAGLFGMVKATQAGSEALAVMTNSTGRAVRRMGTLTVVGKLVKGVFKSMLGPIGAIVTVIGAVTTAFALFSGKSQKVFEDLEQARTEFDQVSGTMEKSRSSIEGVDNQLAELRNRYEELNSDQFLLENTIQNVKNRFIEMGRDAENVGTDVDGLIASLRDLRAELAEDYILDVRQSQDTLANLIQKNEEARRVIRDRMGTAVNERIAVGGRGRNVAMDQINAGRSAFMQSGGSLIMDPNSNLNQVRTGVRQAEIRLSDLGDIAEQRILTTSEQIEKKMIETAVNWGKSLIRNLVEGVRLEEKKSGLKADLRYGRDVGDSRVMRPAGRLANLATNARGRLLGVGTDPELSAIDNLANAEKEYRKIEREARGELDRINSLRDGGILESEQIYEDVKRNFNLTISQMNEVMAGLREEADEVREEQDKIKQQMAEDRLNEIGSKFGEAETRGDVTRLMKQRVGAASSVYSARQMAIQNQGLDPRIESLRMDELNRWFQKILDRIIEDAEKKVAEFDKEDRDRDQQFQEQRTDIENQIRLLKAEAKYGRESLQYARERLEIEHEMEMARIKGLDTLTDAQRARLLMAQREKKAFQDQKLQQEAAVKLAEQFKDKMAEVVAEGRRFASLNLAAPINRALGAAGRLLGRMGQIARRMGGLISESKILEIEGDTVGKPVERARRIEMARAREELGSNVPPAIINRLGEQAAENERKRIANEKAEEAWREANSPDSGGGSEDSSEFDAMLQRLKNTLEAASLKESLGGVATMEGALGEARSELQKREESISRIASKVNRTKEDEERLTELLQQRRDLNDLVEQQEQRILDIKGRQGIAQVNLTKSVKEWAKANLNLNEAINSGIGQTLSAMTNGFAQLFTDLVSGTKRAGQAFMDFARTVVQAMQQALAKMLAVYIMQKLIGMAFPGAKAGDGSLGGIAKSMFSFSATGGMVRKAGGGSVEGKAMRDSVPHLLMPGEYVLRKSAVQMIGKDELDRLNAMGNRRMASGGHVGAAKNAMSNDTPQNLWIVDERTKAPIPGPNDIIAVVNDDISRGGVTKTMIRHVQRGG